MHVSTIGYGPSGRRLAMCLVGATVLSSGALAQQAGPTPQAAPKIPAASNPAGPAIQEVTVTAQRYRTSAQRTPVAINVYTGAALRSANISTVTQLQNIDPSINVTTEPTSTYIAIRGITSSDTTEIGDPAVPVARDGFFVNREYAINTAFYDVSRVEVLKGPQGTLFGRNSTGGLINVITQAPTTTISGYLKGNVGNYGAGGGEGALNVPVSDLLQLRFSGFESYHGGYRLLEPSGQHSDDDRSSSGRVQAAIEPFDGLHVRLLYQHDHINDAGSAGQPKPFGQANPDGETSVYNNIYLPFFNRLTGDRVHWEFSYDKLPLGLTLTYTGGWDSESWHHVADGTNVMTVPISPQEFFQSEAPVTFNHEIRISTPQDQRFSVQMGGFYFQETNNLSSFLHVYSGPLGSGDLVDFPYNVVTKSKAVFGQAGYHLTNTLRLTAGIRYTEDTKDRTGTSQLNCNLAGIPSFVQPFAGCVGQPPTIISDASGHIKDTRPTFHVGLDWQVAPENLLYAKYDTGYKSGGFNSNGSAPPLPYGPETVTTYEVGSKNTFLDRHFKVNADFFYTQYDGYQAEEAVAFLSSGSGVFNVGSARIIGAEGQFVALFDRIGQLDLNMTWLQTKVAQGTFVANGGAPPQEVNVGGNQLPNAPRLVTTAGFERSVDLPFGRLTGRVDGKVSSSYYFDIFDLPQTSSPFYATGDAFVTFDRGPWTATGFVKNFTNANVVGYAAYNTSTETANYTFQPPRTFGATLQYNF